MPTRREARSAELRRLPPGALIGASVAYGTAVVTAAVDSGSVEEFAEKGNWETVVATAGGAIVGGTVGLASSLSTQSSTTTPEVKVTIVKNDIIDLPRVGSALKTDAYHAFNWVGPEISKKEGYLPHYHPTRNHTGYESVHIWFMFYGG